MAAARGAADGAHGDSRRAPLYFSASHGRGDGFQTKLDAMMFLQMRWSFRVSDRDSTRLANFDFDDSRRLLLFASAISLADEALGMTRLRNDSDGQPAPLHFGLGSTTITISFCARRA